MREELEASIERFINSQTSLETYQAISDFVIALEKRPEFITQIEKEGEEIYLARIELNADKGWNYGLGGKELKEHNIRRNEKGEALRQLDLLTPLRSLQDINYKIQPKNIIKFSEFLFYRFTSNDPLPKEYKRDYQNAMNRICKRLLPLVWEELIDELIKASNLEEVAEVKFEAGDIDFSIEKDTLYLGKLAIKISARSGLTKGHYILKHIFNAEEGLDQEYPLSEIAKDEFDDDCKKKDSWKKYHHACINLSDRIRKISNIDDFLLFTSGIKATVRINKKYLK